LGYVAETTKEAAEDFYPGYTRATVVCGQCGLRFSGEELSKLPELPCSKCGYRIFRKVRGPVAKTLKGE